MRIAIIHIGQETNDFNKLPTTLADFAAFGIYQGPEILDRMKGAGQVGGCVDAVADAGMAVEWVPIISAWAMAGGRIDTESRLFFEERIGTGLRNAGRIDALAFHLHGACSAEGVDDVEGAQLAICRAVLGPDVPIVVSLDHHANVTQAMVALSTAIVGHRTQPHDVYDTGRLAGDMLVRILRDGVRPVMAWGEIAPDHPSGTISDRRRPNENLVRPGPREGGRAGGAACRPLPDATLARCRRGRLGCRGGNPGARKCCLRSHTRWVPVHAWPP